MELVDEGENTSLAVIGDGPFRAEMKSALEGYPAHFTGFLSGEELCEGFASADLFVFPSATDTFGNVVLEAQASGLPVIVSDEGGPKELIAEGNSGLIFRAGDKHALKNAIKTVISDKYNFCSMSRSARCFTIESAPDSSLNYSTILMG